MKRKQARPDLVSVHGKTQSVPPALRRAAAELAGACGCRVSISAMAGECSILLTPPGADGLEDHGSFGVTQVTSLPAQIAMARRQRNSMARRWVACADAATAAGLRNLWAVTATYLPTSLRGRGVGRRAYEMLLGYAFGAGADAVGPDVCAGGETSPTAERVWESLRRRYPHRGEWIIKAARKNPRRRPNPPGPGRERVDLAYVKAELSLFGDGEYLDRHMDRPEVRWYEGQFPVARLPRNRPWSPRDARGMVPAMISRKARAEFPPVILFVRSDGRVEVVDGEHRSWAAREAGLETIFAIWGESPVVGR